MTVRNAVLEAYARYGFWKTLARILRKAQRCFFDTNSSFWLERELIKPLPYLKPGLPVTVNFFAGEETIEWLKKHTEKWAYNPRELRLAKEEGHIYVNITYTGEIVGYIKLGFNRIYIEDFKSVLCFPPHCAFIYDSWVKGEFRNKGIRSFAYGEIINFLKERGFSKVASHIPPWNKASRKVSAKIGAAEVFYIRFFRLFCFLRMWSIKNLKTGKVALHTSFPQLY